MSSAQKSTKTEQAAAIANANRIGQETPDSDPRKKADRENEGHLSGSQFTIAETPAFHVSATVGTKK